MTEVPRTELERVAQNAGLLATVTGGPKGAVYAVTVERTADDWSMPPTRIAIGQTLGETHRSAIAAIKAMAPQIQAKLDAASPEAAETDPREERIAVALERIAAALESMVADDG